MVVHFVHCTKMPVKEVAKTEVQHMLCCRVLGPGQASGGNCASTSLLSPKASAPNLEEGVPVLPSRVCSCSKALWRPVDSLTGSLRIHIKDTFRNTSETIGRNKKLRTFS